MSLPSPERVWRQWVGSNLSVHHMEVAYLPASPEEAAAYMAAVLLPVEVSCYSGAQRYAVALDIANEIFIDKVDIHDLIENWQMGRAAEKSPHDCFEV